MVENQSVISAKKRQQSGRWADGGGIPLDSTMRKQRSQVCPWEVSIRRMGERWPGPAVGKPGVRGQIQPYFCVVRERIISLFVMVEKKKEKNNILWHV